MVIVVMVSGRAGEGKSTFSKYCCRFLTDYSIKLSGNQRITATIVPFAKGVKDAAKECFGWDGKKDRKGRKLLQQVGNTGRDYNENIWANKTVLDIDWWRWSQGALHNPHMHVVAFIDDWRFPNEGNVVAEEFEDIIKLRVVRPEEFHTLRGSQLYNDLSETSLPSADENSQFYDGLIYNSTTLDELKNTAEQFCERIILPKLSTEVE